MYFDLFSRILSLQGAEWSLHSACAVWVMLILNKRETELSLQYIYPEFSSAYTEYKLNYVPLILNIGWT